MNILPFRCGRFSIRATQTRCLTHPERRLFFQLLLGGIRTGVLGLNIFSIHYLICRTINILVNAMWSGEN